MEDQQLIKVKKYISEQKQEGKTVALRKGVFDILHPDHLELFKQMKNIAYVAVILILNDLNTAKLKPGRPIMDEESRLEMLRGLKHVDYADIDYSSQDQNGNYSRDIDVSKLKELDPDYFVLAKGTARKFKDYDLGNTKIIEIPEGKRHSTTKIINRIVEKYGQKDA